MNNNFYDDINGIKYLKSLPTTTFYLAPIKHNIIKIVFCEGVIHLITKNSEIYSWGTDINKYGLFGNNDNENFNIENPILNKKLNSLQIFDICTGLRHCCGRDYKKNLYIWGYYFGSEPKIIDKKVRLFNCGNDIVIYCKEDEKNNLYMYDNNHKIIQQFNVENNIRDIFCGDNIIVLRTFNDKIIVISEFGINEIKYYNKNGFRIDNLTVRYNEIFLLLSNSKEQLLLRYTPINEYRYLKISFEFYERLYKINLKKKIKLIYSTSTHYSNGIFFEIDCEEKEKNIFELKSDKIFTLINRNFKIKKAAFEKIKDLTEEQIAIMSNMGKNSNNWKNGINNNMKDLDLINNLKNRNTSLSLEHFFNNSSISDENMINLTGRTFKYNQDNETEEEKRRKRLAKMKEMREKIKKTAKDEYDRLMKEKYDKIKKQEEEEKLRRQKEEEEKLRRKKEEEEKLRRKKEEEEKLRRKKEEEEKLRRQKEEEEKLRKLKEEEEKLRKLKEEEEKLRKQKEEEEKLRRQKEEEERKKQEELERKKEEEKLKLRSKTSENNKNKTKTSKKDKNNFNKKSQNLKSKKKRI